jgi:glutamate-1-semialdehyde 2,1-aminomutase
MRAAGLPVGYPQFFSRGEGCYLWDVDGRKYLDFMCSWGPVVLGHRRPEVDEAARRQMEQGDCLNGPTERMVELAERLVDW